MSFRFLFSFITGTCALSVAACQAPVLEGRPVRTTGAAIVADNPQAYPPDAETKALAKDGAGVASSLAAGWEDVAPLTVALRDKRAAHPAPQAYRLLQVPGWRFFAGGWVKKNEAGREVRVVLDDGDASAVNWDAADSANYTDELHPHFPANAVRLRVDLKDTLAGGGQLSASFILPLGEQYQTAQASGLGSVAQFGEIGNLSFEALNARLKGNGTLEIGDMVLRSTVDGATMIFNGTYGPEGLIQAQLLRTGKPAGKLLPAGFGRLLFTNESGDYSL